MQPQDVLLALDRPFEPRQPLAAAAADADAADAATAAWLERNTRLCGGCGVHLEKSDGCDKVQCLCGWRFCWQCGSVGARCECNPGHGFFDNVLRRPDFSAEARVWRADDGGPGLSAFIAAQRQAGGEAEVNALGARERIEAAYRARSAASQRRKALIMQAVIRDDVDAAVELYLAEVESCGGTPVWAGELAPYVRFLGKETLEAMMPGVTCGPA